MGSKVNSKNPESTLAFILRILGGVGLEVLIIAPVLNLYYNWLHPQVHPVPSLTPSTTFSVIIILLYCIVPIVYCIIASCTQEPKKIISPVQIQVFSAVILGIVVLVMLIASAPPMLSAPEYLAFVGVATMIWFVAIAMFGMVGFYQTLVVRWIVGLNRGKPNDVTYSVDTIFTRVRETVLQKDFLDFWKFKVQKHEPETELVLKSRINLRGTRVDTILIFAPYENENTRTLIHGSAFVEHTYEIRETEEASNRRDHIINDIVGMLEVTKQPLPNVPPRMVEVASGFVNQYTHSKFTVAKAGLAAWFNALFEMPRFLLYAMVLTWIAWILSDALYALLYFTGSPRFEPSLMIDVNVIFFGIALAELGIPAWEAGRNR